MSPVKESSLGHIEQHAGDVSVNEADLDTPVVDEPASTEAETKA